MKTKGVTLRVKGPFPCTASWRSLRGPNSPAENISFVGAVFMPVVFIILGLYQTREGLNKYREISHQAIIFIFSPLNQRV